MQPIKRATVNLAGITMLAKRRLKKRRGQRAKLVGRLMAEDRNPGL